MSSKQLHRHKLAYHPGLSFTALALSLVFISLGSCRPQREPTPLSSVAATPQRIVSLSPAITEILCAIGCADQIVGITAFCKYPPSITNLPSVGGFYDVNYELILALNPDLVLHTIEHEDAAQNLQALGLRCHPLSLLSLPDIITSIELAGALCNAADEALRLKRAIQAGIDAARARVPNNATKPAVLICVGRDWSSEGLLGIYLAGASTIYDEMLRLLNARNVYQGRLPYAQVGREGIMKMNPDVIIDLAPDSATLTGMSKTQLIAGWDELKSVNAVQQHRVYVLDGDYVCIPGPRITQILMDLARAIYPEQHD